MLNALTVSLAADAPGEQRATASMRQQGFEPAGQIRWPGGQAQAWRNPLQTGGDDFFVAGAEGSACCVGPLWYRGRHGNDALRLLLDEARPAAAQAPAGQTVPLVIDEAELRGSFVLLLQVGNRAWLLNDPLGFAHVHLAGAGRFAATSWLAARAWQGDGGIDETAAVQYVLQGAVHANRSVAPGVHKLPLGQGLDLSTGQAWLRFPEGPVSEGEESEASRTDDFEAAANAMAAHLRTVFGEIVAAYPGKASAALSGGFDSRLIVAGLLAHGERPRLFVYGSEDSEDVPIARLVAQGEGLPIEAIDKAVLNQALPEPDLPQLVRSALFFDGLPNDGIHDPGADRDTRLTQSAAGFITLNGGGGEIFRNFFHLPARRYRAMDIVRSFYRGFDAGVFRRADGLAAYERAMATGIVRSLGLPDEAAEGRGIPLSRSQIERIYPSFRCHHWMGLNNSISLRHGLFATPLLDLKMVRDTAALPLDWKNAGRFESRLIALLHPSIASHASSYGFRFSDGPDARAQRQEWLTGLRPARLRPLVNAVRRRLHRVSVSPAMVARYRAMLPGPWSLDPVLDLSRLPDDMAFSRALAVEVVTRELAP